MQQFLSFFRSRGDASINVAILDGRIDCGHPALITADITECPVPEGTPDAAALAVAHGTFVASILFGRGSVQGIVPLCRGLSIPIFPDEGTSQRCSQVDVARSIQIAIERGAHVINISGGQLGTRDEVHPLLVEALQACERQNVLIVAAAGNDGCDCLHIPAAVPSTLAVGAMNSRLEPLALSNWGEAYSANGILAPGTDVLGAAPGGGVERRTGTSFATAMVSGFAALLLCHQIRAGAGPDPGEIKTIILKTANKDGVGPDQQRLMAGRLDVPAAIALVTQLHAERSLKPSTSKQGELMTVEAIEPAAKHATPSIGATPSVEMSSAPPEISDTGSEATIAPSGCGCGGGESCSCGCKAAAAAPAKPQLVYAIGTLGYDLLTEARRDSIQQYMDPLTFGPITNPKKSVTVPADLLEYLEAHPEDAERVAWTLKLGPTPIYAIRPVGAYAYGGYDKIIELFKLQLLKQEDPKRSPLVAVPGVLSGTVRLLSGETVPVLVPNVRGITGWNAKTVIDEVAKKADQRHRRAFENAAPDGMANFLARVERQWRNLGIAGPERALNYAATTAYRVAEVLLHVIPEKLELDDIKVAASAACRPGSECYDIDLRFFNPIEVRLPYLVFRLTIDVSDVVPVGVDELKWWKERPKDH